MNIIINCSRNSKSDNSSFSNTFVLSLLNAELLFVKDYIYIVIAPLTTKYFCHQHRGAFAEFVSSSQTHQSHSGKHALYLMWTENKLATENTLILKYDSPVQTYNEICLGNSEFQATVYFSWEYDNDLHVTLYYYQ